MSGTSLPNHNEPDYSRFFAPIPTDSRFVDITGKKFHGWTVLGYLGERPGRHRVWMCRCECGVQAPVQGQHLKSGASKSCGCRTRCRVVGPPAKHGKSGTRSYRIWKAMLHRCFNSTNNYFHFYGGRGITVCHGFRAFASFYADLGEPPDKHSLDRINTDGHYSCGHCQECADNGWPMNCRWASAKTQMRNTRINRFVTHNGETKTIAEWAEIAGLPHHVLYSRWLLGWAMEDALTFPMQRRTYRKRKGR